MKTGLEACTMRQAAYFQTPLFQRIQTRDAELL